MPESYHLSPSMASTASTTSVAALASLAGSSGNFVENGGNGGGGGGILPPHYPPNTRCDNFAIFMSNHKVQTYYNFLDIDLWPKLLIILISTITSIQKFSKFFFCLMFEEITNLEIMKIFLEIDCQQTFL